MGQQKKSGLSGIVLAGGKSARMGRNKALLELEGQTLVARVLHRLSPLCDDLIISANETELYDHLPARIVPDIIPRRGALSGIHAGLTAARHRRAIVVACDMPFLSRPLLRHMARRSPGYDVVVPQRDGYYEPLHAIYSIRCIVPIERLLAQGPQRIVKLYQQVRVYTLTEEEMRPFDAERSFINVNTPQGWERIQRMVAD